MSINLDEACQTALGLAKRSVPEGAELDFDCLLSSLYFSAGLQKRFPQLASFFDLPNKVRDSVPAQVPVAASLQPVFRGLAEKGDRVTPENFFSALLHAEGGRECLLAHGMKEREYAHLLKTLGDRPVDLSPATQPHLEWRSSPDRKGTIEALSSFGRMLTVTEPPHKGIVRLESALQSLVRTLSKMRRRNAIITGYPGTGKSALIYEFARRMVQGHESIPLKLRDCDIFELSPSFLRSGASMVGQYDERVKALLEILRKHPKVILFIDEIHSLLRSGIHEKGPFSEANESFKSELGSGTISCIGCTTTSDYRHYIEPDKALVRRFTEIRIEPPSSEATLEILVAKRPRLLEYYAGLSVPDEILEKVVELTDDYLPSRYQPDKSIQLIDEACSYCITAEPRRTKVSEKELWQALEDMTGHAIRKAEDLTEADVFNGLRDTIVGQDEALHGIARAFVAGLGSWEKTKGPRGVFFFAGPTGVGKTESAAVLSQILGAGSKAMIRVDCNTIQGSGHDSGPAINRLLGPPPGYIGYARGQGGILSKIRDLPQSIVLFDEIEKADPGVAKLLLQILDDGRIEDVDGNILDFRRSFLIFTTNAGCVYSRKRLGFEESAPEDSSSPHVDLESMRRHFKAIGYGEEFFGRIHHFFVFQGLEMNVIREIVRVQLQGLSQAAEVRGYAFVWDPEIESYLSAQWQPCFGVRHLTTVLRHRISEQLSVAEAQGDLKGVRQIKLRTLPLEDVGGGRELTGLAASERIGDTLVISLA